MKLSVIIASQQEQCKRYLFCWWYLCQEMSSPLVSIMFRAMESNLQSVFFRQFGLWSATGQFTKDLSPGVLLNEIQQRALRKYVVRLYPEQSILWGQWLGRWRGDCRVQEWDEYNFWPWEWVNKYYKTRSYSFLKQAMLIQYQKMVRLVSHTWTAEEMKSSWRIVNWETSHHMNVLKLALLTAWMVVNTLHIFHH